MARAKRTDRADARRRYRQQHHDPSVAQDDAYDERPDETRPSASTPRASGRTPAPSRAPAPSGRVGFTDAMRLAWHRPDVRADVLALPSLLRTKAFLIPLVLVVGGYALLLAAPENPISSFYYRLVLLPPAMAPVFIAGFFAKRASYLLGLVISTIDSIGYVAVLGLIASSVAAIDLTDQQRTDLIVSALVVGPMSGLLFAAAAAWYRRFLSLTGGQRNRARGTAKPKPRRATR